MKDWEECVSIPLRKKNGKNIFMWSEGNSPPHFVNCQSPWFTPTERAVLSFLAELSFCWCFLALIHSLKYFLHFFVAVWTLSFLVAQNWCGLNVFIIECIKLNIHISLNDTQEVLNYCSFLQDM
jgi:hypothetical protein